MDQLYGKLCYYNDILTFIETILILSQPFVAGMGLGYSWDFEIMVALIAFNHWWVEVLTKNGILLFLKVCFELTFLGCEYIGWMIRW